MTDSGKIIVRRTDDEDWTAPESSRYDSEDHLQRVVAASPHWGSRGISPRPSSAEWQTHSLSGAHSVLR